MSRALTIFCACALAFALVVAEEEAPAEEPVQGNENGFSLLLARRTFLNDSFVENRAMSVRIDIWNLGTKYVPLTCMFFVISFAVVSHWLLVSFSQGG